MNIQSTFWSSAQKRRFLYYHFSFFLETKLHSKSLECYLSEGCNTIDRKGPVKPTDSSPCFPVLKELSRAGNSIAFLVALLVHKAGECKIL